MNKLLLTLGCCLTALTTVVGQTKNFIDQPYIEVGGYADTLVTPNLIYIKILITEKDSKDKISLEEQENKMITAFKAMGINTETELTVSDMLSNYKFYLLKQKDIIKTKQYILKVVSAEMASKVFIKLEDLELSNTSIERTDHSDLENIKNSCRTKAIKNAHKKAVALTKPISQMVGNAIHITDDETDFKNQLMGKAAGVQISGYGTIDQVKFVPPKIEFDKIEVSATVSVKFMLK